MPPDVCSPRPTGVVCSLGQAAAPIPGPSGKGDVIFAPQGHYHYFENTSATEELVALIVFNSDAAEPKDDIGIGQSLTSIPNDVLSAVLGVPVSIFEQIPTVPGRIVIVKRPDGQTGASRSES